jgi:two-component system sensor histidine kinase CssS
MKRIRLWLRELSLIQQLVAIIFLVISLFIFFVLGVLSPQVKSFAAAVMTRMLHSSQATVAYYMNLEGTDAVLPPSDNAIQHVLYDTETDEFAYDDSEADLPAELLEDMRAEIQDGVESPEDHSFEVKESSVSSTSIYYSICTLADGRYLVSLASSDYEGQFRSQLVNNVVNLNFLTAAILLMVLTVWMASVIMPLNQIRSYIVKIKNDEPAELKVDRHDEIGEVAYALTDMQAELARQNREKQEMIQNISHDLKTPIATIRSYAESIKDGIYPYGTLEQSAEVIIEHADRLDKKVRSLITLNKMDYLLDACEPGDHLNMSQVIEKVLLSMKVIRPEIIFETDVDKSVCFHGDEEPWRIVVENLLENALRYAKTKIRIVLQPGLLKIMNDGRPIEEDRLKKLFKPYEKGTDGQFGLGLSIVHRVATTYGYHVEAENLTDGVSFNVWKELGRKEIRAIAREKKKEAREEKKQGH